MLVDKRKDVKLATKNILSNIIKNIINYGTNYNTFTSEGHMKKETQKQAEEREAFELKFGFSGAEDSVKLGGKIK